MARSRARRYPRHNIAVLMAGWLFADLLLVLFVAGLGAEPTVYSATGAAPAPDTPPPPAALAKDPVSITINVPFQDLLASGARQRTAQDILRAQVLDGLEREKLIGKRAGMVLVWGHHAEVNSGLRVSGIVSKQLAGIDDAFFGDTSVRSFWRGGPSHESRIDLEIYVLE